MKYKMITTQFFSVIVCSIVFSSAFSQKNAVIINYIGSSNHSVAPIVLSDEVLTQEFADQFLKFRGRISIKVNRINQCLQSVEELRMISNKLASALDSDSDTTTFNYEYGSIEYLVIEDDKVVIRDSVNSYQASIAVLRYFDYLLTQENSGNFSCANEDIQWLIRELTSTPVMRIREEKE